MAAAQVLAQLASAPFAFPVVLLKRVPSLLLSTAVQVVSAPAIKLFGLGLGLTVFLGLLGVVEGDARSKKSCARRVKTPKAPKRSMMSAMAATKTQKTPRWPAEQEYGGVGHTNARAARTRAG